MAISWTVVIEMSDKRFAIDEVISVSHLRSVICFLARIVSDAVFLAVRRDVIACIDASVNSKIVLDKLKKIFKRAAIAEIRFILHHALEGVQEVRELGDIVVVFVFEVLIDILDNEFFCRTQNTIAIFCRHRECSG